MSKSLAQLDDLIGALSQPGAAAASEPPAAAKKPSKKEAASKQKPKKEAAPKEAAAPAAPAAAAPPDPEVERKFALVSSVGEECVTEPELRNLLAKKPNFVLYDGFEPSGRMHIAQGTFKAMNVNKCTAAGGTFVFWVADWFALMNDKMGGDLDRIKTVGQYLIEVWTAAGMDMSRVQFLWSSEEITKHAPRYWTQCLDIARRFTIARIKKCCQIMGRTEGTLTAAQILYPIMQCTDIFFLRADVCQLGVDQRKVNMLAREYCDAAGIKLKPIILSHHMLYGLAKGQQKMSKSNRDSAIFMEDSAADVERKLRQAYCPRAEGEVEERPDEESMSLKTDALKNPCLDYVEHIIFCVPGATFAAGGKTYTSFAPVRDAFLSGALSEEALKDGLVVAVNALLQPVRDHFGKEGRAKEILAQITEWMAEPKGPPKTTLRRLTLLADGERAAVVFAPLPSAAPPLSAAVATLRCLEAAPAGTTRVLWCPDWSAFCLSCLSGGKTVADDLKAVRAGYDVFVGALHALGPATMAKVKVVVQSEAILQDPSNYWISVINAGRAHGLEDVRAVDPTAEGAAPVITALMHVADVLAISADADASAPSCICAPPSQAAAHALAAGYLRSDAAAAAGLKPPQIIEVAAPDLRLKDAAAADDADAELRLLDNAADVQRKIKRAFCEPGNVAFCPPLAVARDVVMALSADRQLVLKRKPEDGGDATFSDGAALEAAIAGGSVHPGDLKAAVRDAADGVLQRVRDAIAADKALAAAVKEVDKVAKRSAKGGGGKKK